MSDILTDLAALNAQENKEYIPQFTALMTGVANKLNTVQTLMFAAVTATSTTELSIGTGEKAFTLDGLDPKSFAPGMRVNASAGALNYMVGHVDSYDAETRVLTLTVAANDIVGSGSHDEWAFSLSGDEGQPGATWHVGAGAPDDGTGKNTDFYLRTSNWNVYVKAAGTWGAPIGSIQGAAGANGTNGTNGAEYFNAATMIDDGDSPHAPANRAFVFVDAQSAAVTVELDNITERCAVVDMYGAGATNNISVAPPSGAQFLAYATDEAFVINTAEVGATYTFYKVSATVYAISKGAPGAAIVGP